MNNLNIKETNQTPHILFDYEKGELSLSGKSYPEDVNLIYKELLNALEAYCSKPNKKSTVNFNWLYYNTATSNIIVRILLMLKNVETELTVNWYHKKDFTMMINKAKLIQEVMNIPIDLHEIPDTTNK